MDKLSIIIPTHKDETPESVEQLHNGTYPLDDVEILICRGGSASTARNAGIKAASHDKLVFLDDDSLPREDYLEQASAALDSHPAVRGCVNHYGSPYGPTSHWYDLGDEPKPCSCLIGCNMAVRSGVIDSVGDFASELPYGHEETEWSERIVAEYQPYYIPEMVVEHQYASSLTDFLEKKYRHGRERVTYRHDIHGESLWAILQDEIDPPNFAASIGSCLVETTNTIGLVHGLGRAVHRSR